MIQRIWDITLTISDLKNSVDFYQNVLGLQKKYAYGNYAGFDCGGIEIGLKTWGELEKPRKGEPCINFSVGDIAKAYESLKDKGVAFEEKPRDTQWGGKIVLFCDPDGNLLQLTQIDWKKYFAANAS